MTFLALLLSTTTAHAKNADLSKCSTTAYGSYITSSLACECLQAKPAGADWWDGVYTNYKDGDSGTQRVLGTCYDDMAWKASLYGAPASDVSKVTTTLLKIGDGALPSSGGWEWWEGDPSSGFPSSVVCDEDVTEISNPVDEDDLLPPFWEEEGLVRLVINGAMVDMFAHDWSYIGTMHIGPRPISHVLRGTFDDGPEPDLLVVFQDGEVWDVKDHVNPYDMIHPPQD